MSILPCGIAEKEVRGSFTLRLVGGCCYGKVRLGWSLIFTGKEFVGLVRWCVGALGFVGSGIVLDDGVVGVVGVSDGE